VFNAATLEKLFHAVIAAGRNPPLDADMTYLVGQTSDNESSVLDAARKFRGPIGFIGYDDVRQVCGFPGFSAWKDALANRSIGANRVVGILGSFVEVAGRRTIHTLSELEAVARYAGHKGLRRVVIVAPHWHLLRSFMSVVLPARRYCPDAHFYPALGAPLPWGEEVAHSQGRVRGTRADFMFTETVRIFTYQEQGNLPSAEEALAYLECRNT